MKQEELVNKGVDKHFDGQKVLFKVESLKEHFDGLQIHDSDVISIEEVAYVKCGDVNFDKATANFVEPKGDVVEAEETIGMTYKEADEQMNLGYLVALPEWGGFWFKSVKTGETIVLTKDGGITNTPFEEFKERNDWVKAEATEEQQLLLDEYFAAQEVLVGEIDVVVTQETLDMNPDLVEEGIEVGETITISVDEDYDAKVVETIPTEKFEEPIE